MPDAAGWGRISGAYGVVLDTSDRAAILVSVTRFLYRQRHERAAPFADDVIKQIAKGKTDTRRSNRSWGARLGKSYRDAVMSQARNAIERELPGGDERLEKYYSDGVAIALACQKATCRVSGQAWNWPGLAGLV
jgi:hypothetical protein